MMHYVIQTAKFKEHESDLLPWLKE